MAVTYPRVQHYRGYSIRIDRMPYHLADSEKQNMREVFDKVMENLAFYARSMFVDKLFATEFLIRIHDEQERLMGFGNAAYRVCGGIRVLHIISIYVVPGFSGSRVMERTWKLFLVLQAIDNDYCRDTPFYFTASTVNLQVLYTTSRVYSIWPDLRYDTPAPQEVIDIAKGANEYYPAPGDHLFQVKITEDYVGLKDGVGHDTSNSEFNRRFYELADPKKYELVFFVGRINAEELTNLMKTTRIDELPDPVAQAG